MALLKGENNFFEIGQIGYKKIKNFMLVLENLIYLRDKMFKKTMLKTVVKGLNLA
jgi:hypothetical protein